MIHRAAPIDISRLDLDLPRARDLMHELGDACAKEMLDNFGGLVENQLKADSTPVSLTDFRNNQRVIDAVTKAFPTHQVIGEEGDLIKSSDFSWVCDPIDGTIPFVTGVPTSVFSLALTFRGTPIMAILQDPYNGGRKFYAELGAGTTLNGKPTRVSDTATLELANIALDEHALAHFKISPQVRLDLYEQRTFCWQFFSIAYAATRIAAGAFAGAVFMGNKPWDIAAAKLVIEEAGGRGTDLDGNDQRYDGFLRGAVLSNGKVHEPLVKLLAGRYN
jgi:fructose-1,6-bisphosphatase/inositol monophosphatase family enzyme